jgi:hypothetical protein
LRKGESAAQGIDRLLFAPNGKLRGEFDLMAALCAPVTRGVNAVE